VSAERVQLEMLVRAVATSAHLPAELICAMIDHESNWRVDLVTYGQVPDPDVFRREHPNAPLDNPLLWSRLGLMQIFGASAWQAGFRGRMEQLLEPANNVRIGCTLLRAKLTAAGWHMVGDSMPIPEAVVRRALGDAASEVIARIPKYETKIPASPGLWGDDA
jgi:soluble lytic murein transglycosylase-like protein